MSGRQRLPNRRSSFVFDFESMGLRFTASISHYRDGRVAECFIDNHKAGSAVGTLVRDSAIILSFALQYGASLSEIGKALSRDSAGRPLGPLGAAVDIITGSSGA
jgi:ribonucleoside-diphosphate reductase alpha chain